MWHLFKVGFIIKIQIIAQQVPMVQWLASWTAIGWTRGSNPIIYSKFSTFLQNRQIFGTEGGATKTSKWSIRTNLVYRVSLTQGFGKTELENEGAGKLLEANVTIISNADCYEKLNNIITTNINGYNSRTQIKQAIYDGITDQLLCTEGLVVKREVCRRNGRGCRTREFITVSFFLHFYQLINSWDPNHQNIWWFSF